MSGPKELFLGLDSAFINFKEKVDPIIWQGRNVNVQSLFEIRIPAQSGSIVKYSFQTVGGDIQFHSQFHTLHAVTETVTESMRVPSDVEKINGTFKSVRDGTFHVLFDNGFSWFNSKTLSYKISLYQPSFTVADASRCVNSQRLLNNAVADTKQSEAKLAETKEEANTYKNEITQLETQLQALQMEIDQKNSALVGVENKTKEYGVQIMQSLEKRRGLCIRCLNHKLLAEVLSFLGKESGAYIASKYWKATLDNYYTRVSKVSGAIEDKEVDA